MYNFYAKDYYYFLVFHMFKYSYWCINEIEQVNWSWEKKKKKHRKTKNNIDRKSETEHVNYWSNKEYNFE